MPIIRKCNCSPIVKEIHKFPGYVCGQPDWSVSFCSQAAMRDTFLGDRSCYIDSGKCLCHAKRKECDFNSQPSNGLCQICC